LFVLYMVPLLFAQTTLVTLAWYWDGGAGWAPAAVVATTRRTAAADRVIMGQGSENER
jgi:hypothetical protein